MASKFSLQAILTLTDKLTGPYGKSTRRITALNSQLGGSFGRLNRGINRTIGFIGKGIARGAALGLGALAGGAALAVKAFIGLDSAITNAGAKFKDLDTTSADYQKTLDQLSTTAREVGKVTEFSAVDSAGALDKFAMAGFGSVQAMVSLRGTTNLATVATTDLTTAVDVATDTLGAFNLVTDDTVQLEKNLSRVSDVMAKTTTTANTNLTELFEAVKSGAPAFSAAGQQIEDFSALAGVMANAGIKGSEAGTALRNVMLRLAKPTGEAADVIKSLGVQTQDSAGNFRNVIDMLSDFEKGLAGMGTAQRTAALTTVFGARAVTSINVLLAEGSDKLADYRNGLIDSAGAAQTMADAMRQSIGNRLKVLKSGLTEIGLKFVEAFQDRGRVLLDRLITSVQNFDVDPIVEKINNLIDFFKKMIAVVKKNKGAIGFLVGALLVFKAAVIAVTVVQAIHLGLMKVGAVMQFAKAILGLAKSEGILKAAQLLLNLAMTANPIGLIIVAIGVLIGLTVLIVKNWDVVKEFFIKMWEAIKKAFKVALDFMKRVMFTFADIILSTYGNIFKAIIKGAAKVGKFLGFDTTGLDKVVEKIEQVQATVREQSFIGGSGDPETAGEAASQETVMNEIRVAQQRQREESRQRHDIFLHGPAGTGVSSTPGGAPESAISLGVQ